MIPSKYFDKILRWTVGGRLPTHPNKLSSYRPAAASTATTVVQCSTCATFLQALRGTRTTVKFVRHGCRKQAVCSATRGRKHTTWKGRDTRYLPGRSPSHTRTRGKGDNPIGRTGCGEQRHQHQSRRIPAGSAAELPSTLFRLLEGHPPANRGTQPKQPLFKRLLRGIHLRLGHPAHVRAQAFAPAPAALLPLLSCLAALVLMVMVKVMATPRPCVTGIRGA